MSKTVYRLIALAALLSVAGCVTPPPASLPEAEFLATGKLGVRSPQGSWVARFRWQQAGDVYDLELWGPFGQGRTRLRGNEARMRVVDGRDQILAEGAPTQIMQRELGVNLPLTSMVHWAQGRPDPALPVANTERDAAGRYAAFAQLAWKVSLPEYTTSAAGQTRPGRLKADDGGVCGFNSVFGMD